MGCAKILLRVMTKSESQIQGKVRLMVALLTTFVFHSSAVAISCDEWFEKLNLKRGSVNCVSECTKAGDKTADADKESYCSPYCRGLCVSDKDDAICKLDPFWAKRLRAAPEPFQTIGGDEQKSVTAALSGLPKNFQPTLLKAIVKGARPHFTAPSSEAASTDEFIILYPRAFAEPSKLDRIIIHEVIHVLILKEWADSFNHYKRASGWSAVDGSGYRRGEFVEFDGKESPEEDFANNVEYFLFDQNTLKIKSPDIFSWLQKNLGKKLRFEKGCVHGK